MKDFIYVFTTWDREDLLEKAIASVPTGEEYRVVQVQPYGSLAAATNAAIKETVIDGDYKTVIICNDDIELLDSTGRALSSTLLQADPKYRIIMTATYNIHEQGNYGYTFISHNKVLAGMFCFCVGRDFVDKVGWFDERFERAWFEDTDMLVRITLADYNAAIVAPVYHNNWQKMDKEDVIARDLAFQRNLARYLEKWGELPGKQFSRYFETHERGWNV